MPTTVAIMQPYFIPYAGYFRLWEAADVVVLFDCVQFPRRGWVHRNRLPTASGELDWLTLPLKKAEYHAPISQLQFQDGATDIINAASRRFPILTEGRTRTPEFAKLLLEPRTHDVTEHLVVTIASITTLLNLSKPLIRSSSLDIDPNARGQNRIIQIAKHVGARTYVNPSGGRELYDHGAFSTHRLSLKFLDDYKGNMASIAARIFGESTESIRRDIISQTRLVE